MPEGREDDARQFFRDILGMTEEEKPSPLNQRGGAWFRLGGCIIHVGVDGAFAPQKKAHPAFLVDDLDALETRLADHGFEIHWDESLPNHRRFYSSDPFGNRLEFMANGQGFSQQKKENKEEMATPNQP